MAVVSIHPSGQVTMLDGDPGVGKSFLTLAIAAAVSQGRALGPGARVGKPGNVLLLAAEDGAADTIRPRLDMVAIVNKMV